MRQKTRKSIRRKMSGSLACLLAAISVFSTTSTIPTLAADNQVKLSYKHEKQEKLAIFVEAENESFSAGENVRLNLYIQNNSGVPLKDGTLKWIDKKQTLTSGGFIFGEDDQAAETEKETVLEEANIESEEVTDESYIESEEPDIDAEDSAAGSEEVSAEPEESVVEPEEVSAEPEESVVEPEEVSAEPEESVVEPEEMSAESEDSAAGSGEVTAEAENSAAGSGEVTDETEAALSKPSGPSFDSDDDLGTAWEEDWTEEDDEESGSDGPYLDENGNLCGISLAPGEIFQVQFSGIIDEDIYALKNRDLRFSFGARKPNGKRLSNNTKFQFNTGLMTMLPIEFEDGNLVETNEENTMLLRLGLDDIEYMFDTVQKEKEDAATPSEAEKATSSEVQKATPSELEEIEFTPAEIIKPETEAGEASAKTETGEAAESELSAETEAGEEESESSAETEAGEEAESESSAETETEEIVESEASAETKAGEEESEAIAETEAGEEESEAIAETETEEAESEEATETETGEAAESESSAETETGEEAESKASAETESGEATETKASAETETGEAAETKESVEREEKASSKTSEAKATVSEAEAEPEDEEEEIDENHSNGIFRAADVKYTIETYGVQLKGVKARFDENASGPAESVAEVSYRVASGTQPGLYFGTVTAAVKYHGNTYKTVQGFHIKVTGEGQMELRGRLGDAEIIVAGDPSSFGAEEHEILSLQVSEISADQEELLSEAMEKKAEETGVAVEEMKALDIKVIADGEVKELEGPVTVTFAGLELEELKPVTEKETKKEKSLMDQALALLSLGEDPEVSEKASEENAQQTTEVWHLDEDAVELNAMESYRNEDGDVVMETDHFSIYLVVTLPTAGGIINVTLEHWGTIETLDGEASARKAADTAFDKTSSTVKTKSVTQQLYTSDVITLQQSNYKNIEELSKVSLAAAGKEHKNYTVDKVWVTTKEANKNQAVWTDYQEYANTDAETQITLSSKSIIRIFYKENGVGESNYYNNAVTFYDHNVSSGRIYRSVSNAYANSGSYWLGYQSDKGTPIVSGSLKYQYLNGIGQGTNEGLGKTGKPVLGSGQPVSGNKSSWRENKLGNSYLNQGNGKAGNEIVTGLVKASLGENGELQFSGDVEAAPFFRETTRNLNGATYYGTKRLDGYQLKFRQQGDTYILSRVTKDGSNQTGDLEKIRDYGNSSVYSNEFWPLDKSINYAGKDPLLGIWNDSGDRMKWAMSETSSETTDKSDFHNSDTNGAHNFHFGMRYDFTFKIGDYTGPMNYYFRGDDDFYLFIDDTLAVDIGGIHIASGQSIDLRKWLSGDAAELARLGTEPTEAIKDYYNNDKEHVYRATVYFMERGGYGSCCYMRCTLPNYTEVPQIEIETTEVTVTKIWDDFENPNRPKNVTVRLLRNGAEIDRREISGTGNTWSYTWSELPVKDGSGKTYSYEVKEVVPAGYASAQSGNVITNRLSPAVKVKVTKDWEDGNNACENRPSSMTFRLAADGEPTDKLITLTKDDQVDGNVNRWTGMFENLPKYKYNYDSDGSYTGVQEIVYTVQEMNGSAVMEKGDTLSGSKGTDPLYQYTLTDISSRTLTSEEQAAHVVNHTAFTNTHTHAFEVTKKWSDGNEAHALDSLWVGLYEKSGTNWKPISGSVKKMTYQDGQIGAVFTGLVAGKEYRVKELVAGSQEDFEFEQSGHYYKGLDEGGIYEKYYAVSYSDLEKTDSCKAGMEITNELRVIRIRVAKWIDNYDEELDHNDLREDEFMIHVKQKDSSFQTGLVLKHAGKPEQGEEVLDESKYSGYLELLPDAENQAVLNFSETVPKEYQTAKPFLTIADGENEMVSVNGDQVTLKPGADAVILVHNTFAHKDYFHSDASVNNKFDHDKIPDQYKRGYVNLAAVVSEPNAEENDDGEET